MNKFQENLSTFLKKNKTKLILGISSFSIVVAFNLPNINWLKEKYLSKNKIRVLEKSEMDVLYLFKQLWYDWRAHTLFVNNENDIDLWHVEWSENTMKNLFHQFSLLKTNQDDTIVIPWSRTSYKEFKQYKNTIRLNVIYNCDIIENIQRVFQFDENDTIIMLAALMNLSLSEYVESEQADDFSVKFVTNSWNNSVDFNGNIMGVIKTVEDKQKFKKMLWVMQKRYNTHDAQSTFISLSQEFGFSLDVDKKETVK